MPGGLGAQGNFPGYALYSYNSVDGGERMTVAFNLDPNSTDYPIMAAIGRLLEDAYCGAKP